MSEGPFAALVKRKNSTTSKNPCFSKITISNKSIVVFFAAVLSLDPGVTYTVGLWVVAHADELLRETTREQIEIFQGQQADEHIKPVKKAYLWHTGKEFKL